jgi:hypothetical protein
VAPPRRSDLVVNDRQRALATLRVGAAARVRAASPATPLGLRLGGEGNGRDAGAFDDDAPTCPQLVAADPPERGIDGLDEPPPLPPPPRGSVALNSDVREAEQVVRLSERLLAVRPALGRLREELARAEPLAERRLLDLATADVTRALVHARRSVRALVALLSDLESEASALTERVGGERW